MALLDWVLEHGKVLSGILLAVVIGWQVYSGMYDWRAVTTSDVLSNPKSWVGRDIVLSNVSIRKYDMREQGVDTFISLWLINGRTNPPQNEATMLVIGKMATQKAKRFESLPWCLKNYGMQRLVRTSVTIQDDFSLLRDYELPLNVSWFATPYWLTMINVNRFVSLKTSVWAGVVVQVLVYGVIAILIVEGLVFVVPKIGD